MKDTSDNTVSIGPLKHTELRPVFAGLLLIVVWAALYIPGTSSLPLVDRDEPRFSHATVEMMARGEWVIPYFNGEYRFDKPVMTYWLMRAGYAFFGICEFGARFHSVLSTLATALALFFMGMRWRDVKTGLFTGFAFLTCLQVLIHGRVAVADMPMVLAVTLSQWAVIELLHRDASARKWPWQSLLYLSLSFGFLVKGPIALLVPGLSLILFRCATWRKPVPWRNLRIGIGAACLLMLVSAWGIPALVMTRGAFWDVGIGKHVVERGLDSFNNRMFLPIYYPLSSLFSLFPWIAFLSAAWLEYRDERDVRTAYLAAWFVSPYIIFTFYKTQLPHYVMPAYPAFFLLACPGILRGLSKSWGRWFFWFNTGLFLIPTVALCIVAVSTPIPPAGAGLRIATAGLAAVFLGLTGIALLVKTSRMRSTLFCVVAVGLGLALTGKGLRDVSASVRLINEFKQMPDNCTFAAFDYKEPSLVFYSDHVWKMTSDPAEILQTASCAGPCFLVVQTEEWKPDRWIQRKSPESSDTADILSGDWSGWTRKDVEGLNLARFTWVRLAILTKGSDPL
ncbi:MAG: glycosyltransferase family 39 protein [Verrucomicrobia bacterium]|nr:glycosyltransferase family 39 protein [Verrucomicrobiota bacterium]